MKLLLDTHVFLWYLSADAQLPVAFLDAIRDPANEVYLSVASVWEAVIKYTVGKLPLIAFVLGAANGGSVIRMASLDIFEGITFVSRISPVSPRTLLPP